MAVMIPALNQEMRSRGIVQVIAAESTGMPFASPYKIAAGLLILLALAGAFIWSEVEIEIVPVRRSS